MRALSLTAILLLAAIPVTPTAAADHPCPAQPDRLGTPAGARRDHVDPADGQDVFEIHLQEGERLIINVAALNTTAEGREVASLAIGSGLCHLYHIWGGPTIVFTAHKTLHYTVGVNATGETDYVLTHIVLPASLEPLPVDDTWVPCGISPYCSGIVEDELCGPYGCWRGHSAG